MFSFHTVGTALIIEDNPVDEQILTNYLKKRGMQVVCTDQLVEIKIILKAQIVDIIFIDIIMRKHNGFQILQEIRKDHTFKEIPIVMMSTHMRNKSAVVKSVNLGAQDFLVKPISRGVINFKLQKILKISA